MGFVENIVNAMRPSAPTEAEKPEVKAETKQPEETAKEAVNNTDSDNVSSDAEDTAESNKTYTEDDLQKKIKEEKEAWEKQRLQNMSQDERIRELEAKLLQQELKGKVHARLEEVKLPIGVADFVQYSDEKGTLENLESTIKTFDQVVREGIDLRLRGKTPQGLGGASSGMNTYTDPFVKAFIEASKKL